MDFAFKENGTAGARYKLVSATRIGTKNYTTKKQKQKNKNTKK